jgi:hypothetical protein
LSTLELAPGETAFVGRDGQPLEMLEWANRALNEEYRIVGRTEHQDVVVLTEWLGIADTVKVSVMYQTHIQEAGKRQQRAWHSHWPSTEDEAEAAHELVVAKVREQANKS